MPRLLHIGVSIGLWVAAFTGPAEGRVFWRQGGGSGLAVLTTTPGWSRVYQSDIRLNQARGHLDVYGCNESLATVMTRLRGAWSSQDPAAALLQADASGWSEIRTDGQVIRLLALETKPAQQSVLFVITLEQAEAQRATAAPKEHQLTVLPPYPGSNPNTFMEDQTADTRLEISTAVAAPTAVQSYYESTLRGNGWTLMTPADPRGPYPGLMIYQKDAEVACILARESAGPGGCTILRMHKRLRALP